MENFKKIDTLMSKLLQNSESIQKNKTNISHSSQLDGDDSTKEPIERCFQMSKNACSREFSLCAY